MLITITSVIILCPVAANADIKIYFNTPYYYKYKPYYYPSYNRHNYNKYRHKRYYRPHSNHYNKKNGYSYYGNNHKNPYHEVIKKYRKRNFRHHAIELGYYDRQRNQKQRQYFRSGR